MKKQKEGQRTRSSLTSNVAGGPGECRPLSETKAPREWRLHKSDSRPETKPNRILAQAPEEIDGERTKNVAATPPLDVALPVAPSSLSVGTEATSQAAVPSEEDSALPRCYGVDRLVLLVRDPYWAYCWWEITGESLARGQQMLGAEVSLVLRLFDITEIEWNGHNHHSFFDVDIEDEAGNWYIELNKPGGGFCAEVGFRDPDGTFLTLIRSNVVTLPRNQVSSVIDEEWMLLEGESRRLFAVAAGTSMGPGSADIRREDEEHLKMHLYSVIGSQFGTSRKDPEFSG